VKQNNNNDNNEVKDEKKENSIDNTFSTLRGSFAGGWQSNNDLLDRKCLIVGIAELIDRMQPSTNDHRK
jgi:hypothetical protein